MYGRTLSDFGPSVLEREFIDEHDGGIAIGSAGTSSLQVQVFSPSSTALKACKIQPSAAPLHTKCGVTVCIPSGIGLTGLFIAFSFRLTFGDLLLGFSVAATILPPWLPRSGTARLP